jgi:hypothetical protein
MKPKYAAGSKVRIKPQSYPGGFLDANIRRYENMTGEVVESTSVVAFLVGSTPSLQRPVERTTVYQYTIRISDEVTLHDVVEDILEMIT